jgi:hypothetical protein
MDLGTLDDVRPEAVAVYTAMAFMLKRAIERLRDVYARREDLAALALIDRQLIACVRALDVLAARNQPEQPTWGGKRLGAGKRRRVSTGENKP